MLGLDRLKSFWAPDVELRDDDLAPEWTRPMPHLPTTEERQTAEAARKAYVARLSVDDPFRPILQPHVRIAAPEVAQRGFKPTMEPPSTEGIFLCRQYPGERWSTTQIVRDAKDQLWMGWLGERRPAEPVTGSHLEWLSPALEGVPRG